MGTQALHFWTTGEAYTNLLLDLFRSGEFHAFKESLQGGNSREDLEAFAKANGGSMDILLMQMAINFGYKMAIENVQEELMKVA